MTRIIPVTIDKKLVSLVIAVSLVGIGVTIFLSFHYANIILEERVMNQLKGESAIRGDSIGSILESKTQQIQVITTNPMIKSLISELNQIPDPEALSTAIPENRIDFLIEVQAFEASIGGLNDLENIEIVGIDGQRLFALVNTKTKKDYLSDPVFAKASKESFAQITLGKDGKRKIITAAPIFEKSKDDTPIGVAIITANTQLVDQILLNRQGLGKTGESYLVNQDKYMISESRFIENAAFKQKVNTPAVEACLATGQNHQGLYSDYRGTIVLGASSCMKNMGLIVLVKIDDIEVFEPVADLRDKIILIGAIITVMVGV
ncbi:MAG: cache domain-containing protein, partial [Thaumarchaeota archaeon]|nr:cache domain-containing protein [Nitrososphaerota archaeon]